MDTYTISRPPIQITCIRRVPRDVAERWIDEHAGWCCGEAVARSRSLRGRLTRVGLVSQGAAAEPATEEVLAKWERRRLPGRIVAAIAGRPGRPRKVFEIGLALERAGVDAARPLALVEVRRAGLVSWSCVVLERIQACTLREFVIARLAGLGRGEARERLKRRLWAAIAGQVARLHAAGARQRDLKAPNILVSTGKDGGLRVSLIDLDGMTLGSRPPSLAVRIRDLARLAVSLREDALAAVGVSKEDWSFLVARYVEEAAKSPPTPEEVDSFVARTLAWAARKEARNRRRSRVIN